MLALKKTTQWRSIVGALSSLIMLSLFASSQSAANTFSVEVGNRAIECTQAPAENGRGKILTCLRPNGEVAAIYFLPVNGTSQVVEENGQLGERVTAQVRRLLGETD